VKERRDNRNRRVITDLKRGIVHTWVGVDFA
jgi:hypothetical protein